MDKKNLLIICTYFPNKKNKASATFVKGQVDVLRNYFDNVYVISLIPFIPKFLCNLRFVPKRAKLSAESNSYKYENVKVYYIRTLRFPFYFFGRYGKKLSIKAINLIEKKKIVFDIIHAHFTWPPSYVGAKIKEKINKPLILTIHENKDWFLDEINNVKNTYIRAWKSADKIIRVNNDDLKEFTKFNISNIILEYVPNGFNDKYFKSIDKNIARDKLNLSSDKTILLNVGNLETYKGHKYLIDSMKHLIEKDENIVLYIIGRGSLKSKLEEQIRNNNLDEYVKLVGGNINIDELVLWYNSCDLFVLPSISESFGVVQIEAMACGKPVVATINGGSESIITDDNVGILVKKKNPIELYKAIISATNKDWNKEYIIEFSKKYSWSNVTKKILEIYNDLLETKSG